MTDLYRGTPAEARENGELEFWRESKKENIRCAEFIRKAMNERYDGKRIPDGIVEESVNEFGVERTRWVIANSILCIGDWDMRVSRANREWAKTVGVTEHEYNYEFSVKLHSCLTDSLAEDFRKYEQEITENPELKISM